jgi:phosphatidylinositol alpha-mannosyltransferase
MRIGLVCPYNYFRPGGVQVCVREIADELKKRGHYVRIIAPRPRKLPKAAAKDVILLGGSAEFNTPFATKSDVGVSASNERIDAILQTENFDVIHFHEPGVPVFGLQVMGRSQSANVATMHATLPDGMVSKSFEKIMKPVAKYIESHAHALTAVSPVAQAAALAYSPAAQVVVVPNGINLAEYTPQKALPPKGSSKTIVYIGRLEKRKGVKYLLDAYALFRQTHADARLIIAGDGGLRRNLEGRVKKYAIPDVSFVGFVSEREKVRLLQTADLYCSPAMYGESFGIVLLEAMAAGCVVLAGNNPGYSSVMTDRGRLSLVNPESTVDFAQRLELLLYDEPLRGLWLDWAKNHVQQFDYRRVVDQYEAVYQQALKTHQAELQ